MPDPINTNCLNGYQCPECLSQGPFRMDTNCIMVWSDDGTSDSDELQIDPNGHSLCGACRHHGPTADFDMEKLYGKNGGKACPYCLSDKIAVDGDLYISDGTACQEVSCSGCGAQWQDEYKLAGLGNFPDTDFVYNHNEELE